MVKVHSRPRRLVALAALALLTSMMVAIPTSASADAPDLFMSEYIEGSSFNKAIEIYNGTGATVDLAVGLYTLELHSNGAATPSKTISLTGTVAVGDVFVIAHPEADVAILAQADLVDSASNVINFNGDDAVILRKAGTIVDAIGQIGFDPGSQWGSDLTSTKDNTLRRAANICAGDTNGTDAFDPTLEWVGFANNTFDGFGSHTADCDGAPPVVDVVINEVDSDTPGSDAAEFVELYDGGAGNTALDGLVVVLYNGSNDLSYSAFDLDGHVTDAGGYFVLGNVGVTGVDVTFGSNGLQNGADAVAVYTANASDFPSGTAVTIDELVDAVVYDTNDSDDAALLALLNAGQPQVNEGGAGDKDNHSNQRCPNGDGGARNTNAFAQFTATPSAENVCVAPVAEVFIHDVQGSGTASPLVGTTVAVEGIVVGDFQDGASGTNGDLNGFHVQEEDADADADALTSEGIFVYDGSPVAVDVAIGDLVRVEGAVSEYNGLTEITSYTGVTVVSSGNPLPALTTLSLPVTSVDDFEATEGMYVTFAQALAISEYYNFARYGEIVVSTDRQFQPTAVYDPGSPAAADLATANALSRVIIDDGRGSQNPDPALHPNGAIFDLSNLFRGGDTLRNVTGVVDYSFGDYKIQPTQGADYAPTNPRTAGPADVGGNITVAAFNVLNYFTTLGSRGADTALEFTRQRDKIFAAMADIDADVLGLMEIENNGTAVADLVNGLNAVVGAGTYAYIDTGEIGSDAIAVAFIYKPATVSLVGDFAVLDDAAFLDPMGYGEAKNRPALAQTFMDSETGGIFTAAVNHLKSKGSSCGVGDDDPEAGSCNVTRTMAAQALADWLAGDPTGSDDEDFLIIGDLNSYDKEDPIDALRAAGYSDLVGDALGEYAYSYVFDGQLGYLDYAMANDALADEVTGVTVWHINADEASLIDYDMSYKKDAQDAIYAADPYRSSDHDPVIIGLDVCDEVAPTFDELTVTPNTLWSPNHKYVNVVATVVVSDDFDPNPTVELVSVVSSEPDNGYDDGNTINDIVIIDDFTFNLRAERSGEGEGRTYTITYQVTDACGNATQQSVTVFVPLRRGGR